MIVDGPRRFGEASLASVARELHLVPVVTAGLIAGILAFLWLEGRGRMAWRYAPLAMARASAAPYRQSSIVSRYLDSAPLAVRISALTTLVLASVLARLAGTRAGGFVLTRQEPIGKWGHSTYALRRVDANEDESPSPL